jgi:hypothetical protein
VGTPIFDGGKFIGLPFRLGEAGDDPIVRNAAREYEIAFETGCVSIASGEM